MSHPLAGRVDSGNRERPWCVLASVRTLRAPWPPILLSSAVVVLVYATWSAWHWGGALEWGLTAGIGVAALASGAALAAGSSRARRWISIALLTWMLAFVAARVFGWEPFEFNPWPDRRYAIFLASLLGLTCLGLVRQWFVARWLAMALAVAGILSAGLNLAPWLSMRGSFTWMLATHVAGALIVIGNLFGAEMRATFARGASEVWVSADPLLRSVRWTVVTHFVAVPMLLVYAWMQPIVPGTATIAIVLAAVLALSLALVVARKAVGAIGLALGGVGLLVHTATIVVAAQELAAPNGTIGLYYAVFWLPAGLAALLCAFRLARPVTRLLLRP